MALVYLPHGLSLGTVLHNAIQDVKELEGKKEEPLDSPSFEVWMKENHAGHAFFS